MTDDELLKMVLRAGSLRAALHGGDIDAAVNGVPLSVMPRLMVALVEFWDAAESAADQCHADAAEFQDQADVSYRNVLAECDRLQSLVDFDALGAVRVAEARASRAERRYEEQVQINVRQAERIAELRHRVKEGA